MEPLEMCVMKYKLQGNIKVWLEPKENGILSHSLVSVKFLCADILKGCDYNKSAKGKPQ